jgi:hypothetical protein
VKILTLDNKTKKKFFYFVLFSLIRTFADRIEMIKENIDEKAYIWKSADGSSDRFVNGSGKQHAVAL